MELCQDDGHGRQALVGDDVDRDAAAAVTDRDRVVGVDRDLDRLVVAGQGLVDGVVDDLVDEVVKPPRTRRADVHPRPQTDRLETFEHGDVLGRVAGLCLSLRHTQEMPAKRRFCEALKVYQKEGSERLFARAKLTAFCTLSRRLSSAMDEAIARARSTSSGATSRCESAGSGSASGSGPGANRTAGAPRARAISAERWPSSNDQIESAVFTCTVPSRAIRAGHAFRAIPAPTAAGQRSTTSAMPAWGPKR